MLADLLEKAAMCLSISFSRSIADFEGHIAVDKLPDGRYKARWNRNPNWTYGWQDVGIYESAEKARRAAQHFHNQKDHPIRNVAHVVLDLANLVEAGPKVDLRPNVVRDWEKIKDSFAHLKQPERDSVPVKDLDLQPNGGVHNILAVYAQASEDEKAYWGSWYIDASGIAQEMADKYGLELSTIAGVLAVLSPASKWWSNVRIASQLLHFWDRYSIPDLGKFASYPANLQKALKILDGAAAGVPAIMHVSGPKVETFYRSLVDPAGTEDSIVLDSHALNIWSGMKRSLKEAIAPSKELRAKIEADYKEAARQLGIAVQALQATTWSIWQAVKAGPQQSEPLEQPRAA